MSYQKIRSNNKGTNNQPVCTMLDCNCFKKYRRADSKVCQPIRASRLCLSSCFAKTSIMPVCNNAQGEYDADSMKNCLILRPLGSFFMLLRMLTFTLIMDEQKHSRTDQS